MTRTLIRTALATLGIASLLAAAGCSQGPVDTKDFDETQEPQVAEPETNATPDKALNKRRGFHDPAKMIEKLDKNGDGLLQLSELPERKARFLGEADTDKDGTLSVAELEAHRGVMKTKMFSRIDSDGDGFVTKAEAGRRWEKIKVADTNNDAKLTQVELEKAHENGTLRFEGRHGKRGFRGMHQRMDPGQWFAKLDTNKNGTLELTELPEKKRSFLESADTNHDQALSKEEMKAHFDAKREGCSKHEKAVDIDQDLSPAL